MGENFVKVWVKRWVKKVSVKTLCENFVKSTSEKRWMKKVSVKTL